MKSTHRFSKKARRDPSLLDCHHACLLAWPSDRRWLGRNDRLASMTLTAQVAGACRGDLAKLLTPAGKLAHMEPAGRDLENAAPGSRRAADLRAKGALPLMIRPIYHSSIHTLDAYGSYGV